MAKTIVTIDQGGTGAKTASDAAEALLESSSGSADQVLTTDGSGNVSWSGFTQTGTGASARTITDKLKDVVSVKDFGATGDGSTDDSSSIQAAIDAVAAAGGEVIVPPGDYLIGTTINLERRVKISGAGRTSAGFAHDDDHVGARFITSSTTMFDNSNLSPAGKVQQVTFQDISFKSGSATGGVLFDFNAVTSGVVDNLNFIRCSLSQLDADKQMIIAPSAGDFFDVHFKECRFYYAQDSTVPMMKFLANTVNNINFDTFTATKANKDDNGGDYFIYMDRQSGGNVENVSISEGILQQTVSGFSDIRAANNVVFRNLAVYDATVDCSNPMFNFAASTGSVQPDSVTMMNVESSFGTTSNPDLKYTTTQTNTYLVMINCEFDKVDLGSGHRFATAVGETPASSSNIVNGHITQLRGQDIRHLTSSGVNDNKEIAFNTAGTIEIDTTLDLTASKLKLNGGGGSADQVLKTDGSGNVSWSGGPAEIGIACSDETSALTEGECATVMVPKGLTIKEVKASLTEAGSSGGVQVNVKYHASDPNSAASIFTTSSALTIATSDYKNNITTFTDGSGGSQSTYTAAEDGFLVVDIPSSSSPDSAARGLKVWVLGEWS